MEAVSPRRLISESARDNMYIFLLLRSKQLDGMAVAISVYYLERPCRGIDGAVSDCLGFKLRRVWCLGLNFDVHVIPRADMLLNQFPHVPIV